MSCSITRWLMTGCVIRRCSRQFVCADTSTFNFKLTSRFGCTRGVGRYSRQHQVCELRIHQRAYSARVPAASPWPDENCLWRQVCDRQSSVWRFGRLSAHFRVLDNLRARIAQDRACRRVRQREDNVVSFRCEADLGGAGVGRGVLPERGRVRVIATLAVCPGSIPRSLRRSVRPPVFDLYHHFRLGFVDVADHFFRPAQFVQGVADDIAFSS